MPRRVLRKKRTRSMKRISRKRNTIQRSRFQGEIVHRKIPIDFKLFGIFSAMTTQGVYSFSDDTVTAQNYIGLVNSQAATGNTGEFLYDNFVFRNMANQYGFYKINGVKLTFRLTSIVQTAFLTLPPVSFMPNPGNTSLIGALAAWDFDDNLKVQINNTAVSGISKYYSMPGVYFNSGTYGGDPLHSDTRYTTFPICGSQLWISTLNASVSGEPNANGVVGLNTIMGYNSVPFLATAPMANTTYDVGLITATFYVSFCCRQDYLVAVPTPSLVKA